jgi:hypothetical protein
MVNTDLNLRNYANIEHIRQTKDRNYHKVNITNKGTAYCVPTRLVVLQKEGNMRQQEVIKLSLL